MDDVADVFRPKEKLRDPLDVEELRNGLRWGAKSIREILSETTNSSDAVRKLHFIADALEQGAKPRTEE